MVFKSFYLPNGTGFDITRRAHLFKARQEFNYVTLIMKEDKGLLY